MEYRRLGNWGMKVSTISQGTWLSHDNGDAENVAIDCTRRAYELGVNLFDTANEYQNGRAEHILGRALRPFARDTYLVASKVYFPMGDGPLERGLSRKHIRAQVDQSLRRLGTDHIDLYQCHMFDAETPLEETARTMDDLIRHGKILYWGISNWSAHQVEQVATVCRSHGWEPPVSNQLHYSALWREIETDLIPACEKHGTGVLAFSPLAMGVLTGKYRPGYHRPADTRGHRGVGLLDWLLERFLARNVLEAVEEFTKLAKDCGYSPTHLALAWCLRLPAVSAVIMGASRPSQVEDNVRAADLTVDADLLARIDNILSPVATIESEFY